MNKMIMFVLILILVLNISGVEAADLVQIGGEQIEQQEVTELTREEAVEAIALAEKYIQEIKYASFNTKYVEDLLIEAEQSLVRVDHAKEQEWEGFSYDEVLISTQKIADAKDQVYILSDELVVLDIKLSEYADQSIETLEAETLFESAKTAFDEERYTEAAELIEKTNSELDDKKAERTSVKALTASGKSFVERNWWQLIIAIVVLSVAGMLGYKKWFVWRIKKKIKHLNTKHTTLLGLMIKAQRERFEKGTIPNSTYKIRMEKYQDKLIEIKRTLPVFKAQLKKKVKHIKPQAKKVKHKLKIVKHRIKWRHKPIGHAKTKKVRNKIKRKSRK
jgi:hypothetical protein